MGHVLAATGVMWFVTIKFIFVSAMNIAMLSIFIPSSWDLLSENKRIKGVNLRLAMMRAQNNAINSMPSRLPPPVYNVQNNNNINVAEI